MLRITFIVGYALLTILLIASIALKTIAVVGTGGLGEFASNIEEQLSHPATLLTTVSIIAIAIAAWIGLLISLAKKAPEWERKWVKTLIIGCSVMFIFFLALAILALCAIYLEGFPKTVAEKIAGLISSPVIMELNFFFMGFFLLIAFNTFRRMREGDEYVYLEVVDEPSAKSSLPATKQITIYKDLPETFHGDLDLHIATIEGALDMKDTEQAFNLLMEFPQETLDTPQVKTLCQRLDELKNA